MMMQSLLFWNNCMLSVILHYRNLCTFSLFRCCILDSKPCVLDAEMYSVYRESVVRKSVSAWQQWAVGSRRLLISLYNCIQAPAPGGHPSLANTGPGWIKLCGYSRRYRAGPHHHREPWGQARTRTEVTSNQEPVSVSCHYVSCSKNHAFI